MCKYLKRMSPQDTPTDDIRLWSGLAHSVVEYTGPKPFGMDGSVCLWLHEKSATQLLDMCDELDAKFSDLKLENTKLRELVRDMWHDIPKSESCEFNIYLGHCTPKTPCNGECAHWYRMKELGIEVK